MGTINTSMQAVQQAQADLGEVDDLPPLGQDMVQYNTHAHAFSHTHTHTHTTFSHTHYILSHTHTLK